MRYTKYYPSAGYVSVQSGGNLFNTILSGFSRLPPIAKEALTLAGETTARSGAKAAGDRLGRKIAEKIIPMSKKPAANRKEILKDLQLHTLQHSEGVKKESPPLPSQYGFGKKIRGRGIKILT